MYKYQGFTLPMWSWSNSTAELESLQQLKSTGANSVIIDFHLSTDSMSGSVVDYRKNDKTLSQLNEAIVTAKSQGLDVWFKPLVLAGYGPDQNNWQDLAPQNTSQWFSTYKVKLLEIAKVLEDNKVSHFVITNELLSLTTNPQNITYWQDIISSLRQVYHGQIGFNCGALLGPWANGNEILSVPQTILDSLDFIGLSSYPRVQQTSEFTVQSVTAGWFNSAYQQNLLKTLSDFIAKQSKPVYFTELGNPAYQGGNYTYGSNFNADLSGQANFYTATLEVLNKYFPTEIQGVFIYNWLMTNYPNWLKNSGSYSPYDWGINGKPAQQVIANEFLKSPQLSLSKIYALPFSESIKGAESTDTVVFDKNLSQSKITRLSNSIEVKDLDSNMNYSLSDIERLQFSDKSVAFDTDGKAGTAVKILGAVFGKSAVAYKEYVGIGLDLLDKGMSYDTLAGLALNAAKATTNDQIVTTLWTNVVGSTPSAADKAPFIKMLEDGMTPGALAHMAADTSYNTANINLVGLAQTGIEYTPVA